MDELDGIYGRIKPEIIKRIEDFCVIGNSDSIKDIFEELCFCLLTPQSKAIMADRVMKLITSSGILYDRGVDSVYLSDYLKQVRFKNNKAKYILEARDKIVYGDFPLLAVLKKDPYEARDILVKEIKGFGYKEASHFLRNIGKGDRLAILDRHILKNMLLSGVIKEIPDTLNRKMYLEIEVAFLKFADSINIPAAHLDFVMWYKEAGAVFK